MNKYVFYQDHGEYNALIINISERTCKRPRHKEDDFIKFFYKSYDFLESWSREIKIMEFYE